MSEIEESGEERRCHECTQVADDECVRCERPTCGACFAEQAHLGLCRCCDDELAATGLPITEWPYPLRAPLPEG